MDQSKHTDLPAVIINLEEHEVVSEVGLVRFPVRSVGVRAVDGKSPRPRFEPVDEIKQVAVPTLDDGFADTLAPQPANTLAEPVSKRGA